LKKRPHPEEPALAGVSKDELQNISRTADQIAPISPRHCCVAAMDHGCIQGKGRINDNDANGIVVKQ
jgi:hypothetical protein